MANNNWAVVIGINQYKYLPEAQLSYAESDAQNMRDFLCQKAGFAPKNILLCSDHSKLVGRLLTAPDYTNLRKLLHEDIQQARDADLFWFFFSGHGMVGQDEEDYLLARDSNPNDLETAISINFVIQCLRRCQAKDIILILDMCRHERADVGKGAEAEVGRQTEEIVRQQGIITIFSCRRGERSYEIADLKQGAFTYALLEGMNHHTILRQLENYLIKRVPELNKQYGKHIQVPLIIPEPGLKYDLPLLPDCATEADIKALMETAKDAELDEDYEKAKRLWWQINEFASSRTLRVSVRKAIERIERKKSRVETIHADFTDRELEETFTSQLQPTETKPEPPKSTPSKPETKPKPQVKLKREKGVDYTKLRDLLNAGKWKEADQETWTVMCQAAGREKEGCLRDDDIQNFPCEDLRTIDQLWVKYSNGKFGFSVQKQIWLDCGGVAGEYDYGVYTMYGDHVGWRQGTQWLNYDELTFQLLDATPRGNLPARSHLPSLDARSFTSFQTLGPCCLLFSCLETTEERLKPTETKPETPKPSPSKPETQPKPQVELKSDKGVDYTKLCYLLATGKWKEADQETADRMLQAMEKFTWWDVDVEDIENFPCEDLRTIDQLWVQHSKGCFGFSVQKEIYTSLGGTREYNWEMWKKFGSQVGWLKGGGWLFWDWDDLTFELNNTTSKGHLPGRIAMEEYKEKSTCSMMGIFTECTALFSRVQACGIYRGVQSY